MTASTPIETATARWSASPQQVEKVIAPALPHAASDNYFPLICCINLEIRDGKLFGAATDRYTLAVGWEALAEWDADVEPQPNVSARIFATDVRRVFAFLKLRRKDVATWELSADGLTVTSKGETLTVRSVDVEFIDWRALLGTQAEKRGDGTAVMRFTPRMIGAFLASAKAIGEGFGIMRWRFGASPLDPALIEIGPRFIGMLMPQRLEEDPPQLDLSSFGIANIDTEASA